MGTEVRVGIVGLGVAARQILHGFSEVEGARLTAVADPRPEARQQFQEQFGVKEYDSIEALCKDGEIDAVWVATPNHLHAEHTIVAAEHGKHVICEKPMAVTLDESHAMVEAIERNGVRYVQGHSRIFRPYLRTMGEIISSGRLGRVIHIDSLMYNDWLRRPVMASEVEEKRGGGVVYRQGPHHMDIVRYLAGGVIRSIRATAGRNNPHFDIEGDYAAFLDFENRVTASLTFGGYGHLEIAELTWNVGEGGRPMTEERLWKPRRKPTGPVSAEEKYAHPEYSMAAMQAMMGGPHPFQDFFGLTIVMCERGDIRQSPNGLYVYTDNGREEIELSPKALSAGELAELVACVSEGRDAFPNAQWGRASLEGCLGIIESSRERREVYLRHQVPSPVVATPVAVAA
jgi:phthalate 4,5-cis-dihydrodiol dehydrogenase